MQDDTAECAQIPVRAWDRDLRHNVKYLEFSSRTMEGVKLKSKHVVEIALRSFQQPLPVGATAANILHTGFIRS